MKWETVIGLEVHAELSTKSKIFCGCAAAFGGEPNTNVCPVCSAMPGSLPKLNKAVVEYASRAGLALGCKIARNFKFDRKNYFYPDNPKAYQISQLYAPLCTDGFIEIGTENGTKKINIREIHMEEDAGKLTHDPFYGNTQMDFNRCGVPLIEIVSQPDFRSSGEVIAYLERLQEILLYLGISDCKMHEGSMRVDVNLSIRPLDGKMGVRTETKNLNSLKAIERAIKYEAARQIGLLESGTEIIQETRRWDDEAGMSYSMRSKENAQDYRYFPEPDLLPVNVDDVWLENIMQSIPELAHQKRERYKRDYGISEYNAKLLTGHINIADLFEAVCAQSGEINETVNLITGEIMYLMNKHSKLPENLSLNKGSLSTLVKYVLSGKINRNVYKEVVEAVFLDDAEPETYISKKGLFMLSDNSMVIETVKKVLLENEAAVKDYRAGKEKAFTFLMGQTMKKLGGAANPEMVKKALEERIAKNV